MEDQIRIAGEWYGEQTYEDDHRPELKDKKMSFRLSLSENDGDISGECVDTEGTGFVSETASITGFIDADVISFVKQYPGFYFINYQAEVEKDEGKEPAEINFSGTYNAENDSFEGDWHVIYQVKQLTFGFAEQLVSGSWFMKRVK